jgi:hypothetical protein
MRDTLEVEASSIELRVDESEFPDDLAVLAADYHGPDLVVVAHANRIASLSAQGRVVRPLPARTATILLEAARAARTEQVEQGMDTALSRRITTLRVRVDHARGPSHSFALVGAINHSDPYALPQLWSTFLRTLRDAIGPLEGPVSDTWDLALTWTGPFDLGPTFRHGGVVAVPHLVTAFTVDGPIYIRTGQPPVAGDPYRTVTASPSVLYHFDGQVLVDVASKRALAAIDKHRWQLPCGGGTVTYHHEWQTPARVVVRVDDPARGIYVQKA